MPNKNSKKQYLIIAVATLLVITIGFTAAYFQAQVGNGATANVTVTTKTTDLLTFSKGNDISITATQANFYSGAGNRTGSTTATATLLANNDTNSATQTYKINLNITVNNFTYTTAPTNTPELLLTITDPNNQAVTSLDGLTYTTVNGVSGFDITTKTGLISIASNYVIISNSSITATNQTWTITVTIINLNSDQQVNTNKTFTAQITIQEDPGYYWNNDFPEYIECYYYSYPLGEKLLASDYNNNPTNWTSGSPTTYQSLAQLQSNTTNFSNSPVYIKTTDKHQACLFYNNHEFCLGAYYWEGTIRVGDYAAGLATMNKLQAEMETALGTNANQNGCYSNSGYADCSFGDFHCVASFTGYVLCAASMSGAFCEVYPDGPADCSVD